MAAPALQRLLFSRLQGTPCSSSPLQHVLAALTASYQCFDVLGHERTISHFSSSSSSSSYSSTDGSHASTACSTSFSSEHVHPWQRAWKPSHSWASQPFLYQQHGARGYAKKPAAKGKAAAVVVKKAPPEPNPYAPAAFKPVKRRRVDAVESLPASQKALLQALVPDGKPLRSLRQVGWDLAPKDVLGLLHSSLGASLNGGQPVFVAPFVVQGFFQSAVSVAQTVRMCMEANIPFMQVQQYLLGVIAAEPDPTVAGIKVQVKGRLSGKGGKASKKVWAWGTTSLQNFDDPVDYSEQVALTRAGYIGVKVWIVYKRESIGTNWYSHRNKSPLTLQQVLAMPRSAPVARSSSAWWSLPGPLQPAQFRVWEAFGPGYDPVAGSGSALTSGGGQVAALSGMASARGGMGGAVMEGGEQLGGAGSGGEELAAGGGSSSSSGSESDA